MIDSGGLDEQVLGWLSPDQRDPASISQLEAQELAWYTAPWKWNLSAGELREVAAACARLLESSGRQRAAAALRDHTPAVLTAWARSRSAGVTACTRAMQATGVQAPDTPSLRWAQFMGGDEATVLDAAERMLESAIDEGAFTPGELSWRARQRDLLDAWLRAPSTLFAGRVPVDVVHTERTARWAEEGTTARRAALRAVLPALAAPTIRVPDTVAPLRFLLEAISEGVTLTSTGRLPPQLVRAAAARFGWGLAAFTIRKEGDVVEVGELRDLATRARLIAVRRRQLTLTETGRAALDDEGGLWFAAAAGWFDQDDFAAGIAELAAVILLEGPATSEALTSAAYEAVAPGFEDRAGAHPDLQEVRLALWEWLRPGHALGWLSYLGGQAGQHHQLTDPGRAAVLDGLRYRAHAPRNHP